MGEHTEITIILPDVSIQFDAIAVVDYFPKFVVLSRISRTEEYPELDLYTARNVQGFFLSESRNLVFQYLINELQSIFIEDEDSIIELDDPLNPEAFYLLLYQDNSLILSKFVLTEIFADYPSSLMYSLETKIINMILLRETKLNRARLNKMSSDLQYSYQSYLSYINSEFNLEEDLQKTKQVVRQLYEQVVSLKQSLKAKIPQGFECDNCLNLIRDIVAIPCGHLQHCKQCIASKFSIKFNEPLENSFSFDCMICSSKVQELRIVRLK